MIYLIYAEIGRLYSGFDDYPDLCRNFGIELDCCVVFTDGFNVVSNDDFLFIHLNAEDSADFFGNILCGNGTVQPSVNTACRFEDNRSIV